jgi:hypothetical protein
MRLLALFFAFLDASVPVVFAIFFAGKFGLLFAVTVDSRPGAPSLVGAATSP